MISAINANVINKTQDYKTLNRMFQILDLTPADYLTTSGKVMLSALAN
ncbi:MAG: hypothetical protein ABFD00_03465 [Chloroherpetonaceae bacterium]